MPLPLNLVLVRHGESEGNDANRRSRKGDHGAFTPDFRTRHSSTWRLTDRGITQAQAAGTWLKANQLDRFDRYSVSTYLRAVETAALLNLPAPKWYIEYYLREREWGDLDTLPDNERQERFAEALAKRKADSFYWQPPGGESLAQASLRVDRSIETHSRETSTGSALIVCHGEIMTLFRVRIERIGQHEFKEATETRSEKINNCQILHYSRQDEHGQIFPFMVRRRSICPWDPSRSTNEWRPIVRQSYSNADLLAIAQSVARMVN